MIYEHLLPECLPRERYGKILRRLPATSGFAGLYLGKKKRQEESVSKKLSQNLKAACADLVAGQAARTVKKNEKVLFKPIGQ